MRFEIVYVDRRKPKRIVDEKRFEKSSAFFPVMQMQVGEVAPRGRYWSAGIRSIKRVA